MNADSNESFPAIFFLGIVFDCDSVHDINIGLPSDSESRVLFDTE
jgi:hypothetical protein